MHLRTRPLTLLLLLVAGLMILASCGGESEGDGHAHDALGEAGDPSNVDRSLAVSMDDPFDFNPDELSVEQGETILFVVTNEGDQEHEFVIGEEGGHEHGEHEDGPNSVLVPPGETKELAWSFTRSGMVKFNCFVAGHNKAGMTGTISVAPGS